MPGCSGSSCTPGRGDVPMPVWRGRSSPPPAAWADVWGWGGWEPPGEGGPLRVPGQPGGGSASAQPLRGGGMARGCRAGPAPPAGSGGKRRWLQGNHRGPQSSRKRGWELHFHHVLGVCGCSFESFSRGFFRGKTITQPSFPLCTLEESNPRGVTPPEKQGLPIPSPEVCISYPACSLEKNLAQDQPDLQSRVWF